MQGIIMAKEFFALYSTQVKSLKWRHCIFSFLFFFLDLIVENMYIIYLECLNNASYS